MTTYCSCMDGPNDPDPACAVCHGSGVWIERGDAPADVKDSIADEAKRIVSGARRGAYGTPERNFERIAVLWTAYFKAKGLDVIVAAADVSPMMRLMKEARIIETPDHRDSHVDLVGYTLTGAEVNGVAPVVSVLTTNSGK